MQKGFCSLTAYCVNFTTVIGLDGSRYYFTKISLVSVTIFQHDWI